MSKIISVNDSTFESVINKNELTIVKFGATWCGPCKMIASELHDISENYGHLTIAEVDIDDLNSSKVTETYDVKMVPTVVFFKNGQEVERFVGFKPKEVILDISKKHEK